nr:GNAT family N-acetyltransferase [Cognatishimia sp. F0-27]
MRPARPDDLDPMHAIFTDPRAMRYWDRPPHTSLAETERVVDHLVKAPLDLREEYVLEREGLCIGKAGVWRKPELGYILHPDHWGQGLAHEALRAILPRAWARWPDMQVMTAELDPRNVGSVRVLEKLGFTCVRVAEKNFLYGGIEWTDTGYYALRRPPGR